MASAGFIRSAGGCQWSAPCLSFRLCCSRRRGTLPQTAHTRAGRTTGVFSVDNERRRLTSSRKAGNSLPPGAVRAARCHSRGTATTRSSGFLPEPTFRGECSHVAAAGMGRGPASPTSRHPASFRQTGEVRSLAFASHFRVADHPGAIQGTHFRIRVFERFDWLLAGVTVLATSSVALTTPERLRCDSRHA